MKLTHNNYSEPSERRKYREPSREEMIKGDRVVFILMTLAAIALALMITI
ncbi:hypothetical protein [Pedobacter nototheniae]|nr:hypothetical protein [Pedobacter nototheniae]